MTEKRYGKALICAVLALLCASCANTPGKVVRQVTETAAAVDGAYTNDSGVDEVGEEVASSEPLEQDDPFAPTVTPIILPVTVRGEAQEIPGLISGVDDSQMVYHEESQMGVTAVAVSAPSSVQMADAAKLYASQPMSGQTFTAGQSIYLDLTLYNAGTTTWMPTYTVTDISATPLTVERTKNLPMAVAPGGTVMVSFYVVVPQMDAGSFGLTFQIKDASGIPFGTFDWSGNVGTYSAATAIITLTPSVTPTYYSPDGITATPDSLAWMCVDPERSKLQDCHQFCVEYSDKFPYCFYDGERYQP